MLKKILRIDVYNGEKVPKGNGEIKMFLGQVFCIFGFSNKEFSARYQMFSKSLFDYNCKFSMSPE
jgi:hypothetical protein